MQHLLKLICYPPNQEDRDILCRFLAQARWRTGSYMTGIGAGRSYRAHMMYLLVIVGIYLLAVAALLCVTFLRPNALWRLQPFIGVALFSFVPAIAIGREVFLRTEFWEVFSGILIWFRALISGLFIAGIIPLRHWIRMNVLDRTANTARRFLDRLPERMMSLAAEESRSKITGEEAAQHKLQIQGECDRLSAIDGIGRFLYMLLKVHLIRLSLQILGAVTIEVISRDASGWYLLSLGSSLISVDVVLILVPYLLLVGAVALLERRTFVE